MAGLVWASPGLAADGEEPDFLALSAGVFDINDDETSGEFRAEYRSNLRLWKIAPFIGGSVNTDGGFYGYAGLGVDIYFGRNIVLTPNAAFVAYEKGDSKDLGGFFNFRTGGEIAWRFDNWSRLGVAFHHISNAGIYESNPGTELLVMTYSIPLRKR
jgi:hypothetical protein